MQTKTSQDADVLVVGGGASGLLLALLLQRAGIKVRLIDPEASADPRPRPSILHSRSLELLELFDLLPPVVANSHEIEGVEFYREGKLLKRLDFRGLQTPFPFARALNRGILEDFFQDVFERGGGRVERNTKILAAWLESDGVRCKIDDANGVIEQLTYRYVVGCDGGGRVLRECLGIGFRPLGEEVFYGFVEAAVEGGIPRNRSSVFFHPEGLLEFLPLESFSKNQPSRYRIMAVLPIVDKKSEFTVEQMQLIVQERVGEGIFLSSPSWSGRTRIRPALARRFSAGKVLLTGSDAHRQNPIAGQSLDSSLGDAFNLAWKLVAVLRGDSPPSLVEASYSEERSKTALFSIEAAQRLLNFGRNETGPVSFFDKFSKILTEHRTIDHTLAQDISHLSHNYRNSPLTFELRKKFLTPNQMRAGERIPDAVVPFSNGKNIRLYNLLRGSEFSLILRPLNFEEYGAASFGNMRFFSEEATSAFRGKLRVIWALPPALIPQATRGGLNFIADVGGNISHLLGIEPCGAVLIRPDFYSVWASAQPNIAEFRLAISHFWT
ncbi:MAG: FAD-dependent monooxygenase [Chthoniobacterales bacterium]|nr:FAD-dependent monooxygenase [Chthoniobacterales bacterium]